MVDTPSEAEAATASEAEAATASEAVAVAASEAVAVTALAAVAVTASEAEATPVVDTAEAGGITTSLLSLKFVREALFALYQGTIQAAIENT